MFHSQYDIFNPLTTLHIEEIRRPHEWSETHGYFTPSSQCVFFQDHLYVGGTKRFCSGGSQVIQKNTLCVCNLNFSSWSLSRVPTESFGLAVYNSQLVLVGGRDRVSKEVTDKLWTSGDGRKWTEGALPPMPTPREEPLAESFGTDPECLLVASESRKERKNILSVSILKGGHWSITEPVSNYLWFNSNSTLFNGGVYMCNGYNIFGCKMDALLRKCVDPKSEVKSSGLWRKLETPSRILRGGLCSFKGQLLYFSLTPALQYLVHAYCPYKQSWVRILKLPAGGELITVASLPMVSILILRAKIYKVSTTGEYTCISSNYTLGVLWSLMII